VERRLVEPLPLHVEEVAALQRDCANAADLVGSNGAGERDLAGHGSTADDGRLQVELLHHRCNAADIGVLVVGVAAGIVALVLRAVRVREMSRKQRQVEFTGNDLPWAGRSKAVMRSFSRARGSFITLLRVSKSRNS
jgi:hypothetical protein